MSGDWDREIEKREGLARWKPRPTVVEETDDPMGRCWAHLSMFTEPGIVARHIAAVTGDQPTELLCQRVANQIQQAREFFETAGKSTLNTRPTVLFYGALNLAGAVYSLRQNGQDSGKHGMDSKEGPHLGVWTVTFRENGVVHDFARLFGAVVTRTDGGKQSQRVAVSLSELLRRDPSTAALLGRHGVVASGCARVVKVHESRTIDFPGPELNVWVFTGATENDGEVLTRHLPVLPSTHTLDTFNATVSKGDLHLVSPFGQDYTVIHGRVVTSAIPGQAGWWPLPVRQLAMLWLLSEISRYSPESFSQSGPVQSRQALPAIEIFMRDTMRSFPNDCLNLIYGYCLNFRPAPSERKSATGIDNDW